MNGAQYLASEISDKNLRIADLLDRNNALAAQLRQYEDVLTKAQRKKLGLDPDDD